MTDEVIIRFHLCFFTVAAGMVGQYYCISFVSMAVRVRILLMVFISFYHGELSKTVPK